MQYVEWQPNTAIESPVYLDANILVGAKVRNHALYGACVQLVAEMLATKTNILVSGLSLDETMWAMAKLAYCNINNQPSNAAWYKSTYERWRERIFQLYGEWITAAGDMLGDWKNAGVNVDFAPNENSEYEGMINTAPTYMRQYGLTPRDAFHLAIAEKRAKTFITADSDFAKLRNNPPQVNLTILHVAKT